MVLKLDKETMDQLTALISEIVQDKIDEKLEELLGDSDKDIELTDEAKIRIEESLAEDKSGNQGVSLEEFAQEMGIELE